MGLKLCVFGSGSTGNCVFLSGGTTNILIDQGLPLSRVEQNLATLGVNPETVSVLVTHTHTDHTAGIKRFAAKYGAAVYCAPDSAPALRRQLGEKTQLNTFFGDHFYVGDLTVSPFSVSHDVPCVGYSVYFGGNKACVATDLGCLSGRIQEELLDSDIVLIESNHDEDMLYQNAAYPAQLKRRILSERGHLSNRACAECIAAAAGQGVKHFVLGHLSKENNYPELAFETVTRRLKNAGLYEGRDLCIEVALPDVATRCIEVG